MGYVYILQMNGCWKIGMTNNLKGRMSQYAALPFPIESLYLIETDNPELLEKKLHKKYRHKGERSKGEWFYLDEADLQQIKYYYRCESGEGIVKIKPRPTIAIIPKYKGPGILLNTIFAALTATMASGMVSDMIWKIWMFCAGLYSNIVAQYIFNLGHYYFDKSKAKSYLCFGFYIMYILILVLVPLLGYLKFMSQFAVNTVLFGLIFILTCMVTRFIQINRKYSLLEEYEIIDHQGHAGVEVDL